MPVGFFAASAGTMPYLGSARSQGTSYSQTELIGANGSVSEGDHRLFATPHQVSPGEGFQVIFDFPRGQVRSLAFGADTNAHIFARVETRGVRRRPVA